MAIAGSGAISLSDFRTEFVGGSAAISLGDLYRGGSNIRSKAANNNAINLASDVPTSGVIAFDDFYGTAKGFRKTYTATATNQNASTVFGDDYGVDYPKEIVINSGVELGATSTSEEALQIDSGLSGTMTITNNGTLTGAGGAAGAAGGDAFQADVTCTLINNGTIRAGGGGGGAGGAGGSGGTGGQGSQAYSYYTAWNYVYNYNTKYVFTLDATTHAWKWYPEYFGNIYRTNTNNWSGYGAEWTKGSYGSNSRYYIGRRTLESGTNYFNGGSGGAGGSAGSGGVGAGYNQSAGSGSSGGSGSGGSAGGTNAGAGGSGGSGGSGGAGGGFGQAGSTGSNGASGNSGSNGNYTNGSAGSGGGSGSGGGAAGKYLRGSSFVTFTNNGTVQGGTA